MKILKVLCTVMLITLLATYGMTMLAGAAGPTLLLGDVKSSPGTFMSGDVGEITVMLTNSLKAATQGTTTTSTNTYSYGPGTSNGLTTPSHTEQTTTASSDAPDSSIVIKKVELISGSGVPVRVVSQAITDYGSLGMGDAARYTFLLQANADAKDGVYFLTLKVTTNNDAVYLNAPVRVEVDNRPVKLIFTDAPTSLSTAFKGVSLDVVNVRKNEVGLVSIIPSGSEFIFKPGSENYIGNIAAADMYTASFDVASREKTYSTNPTFKVVYKNGDNWHETAPYTLALSPASSEKVSDAGNNNGLLIVLGVAGLLLLGVIGAFFLLRSRRPKSP